MVAKLCFTSHGHPLTGSRRRAMTARRSSSVYRSAPGGFDVWSGIAQARGLAGDGAPSRTKFMRIVKGIEKLRHFLPHIPDSHKVYYGKFYAWWFPWGRPLSAALIMVADQPVEAPHG